MKHVIYINEILRPDVKAYLDMHNIPIILMSYMNKDYVRAEFDDEDATLMKLKFPNIKIFNRP